MYNRKQFEHVNKQINGVAKSNIETKQLFNFISFKHI